MVSQIIKMRLKPILSLMLAATAAASAQNPVVQTCYTTDPAPMVHDDTFYIYTGHDENGADFFWMQEWRVYSSKDMVNWTDPLQSYRGDGYRSGCRRHAGRAV